MFIGATAFTRPAREFMQREILTVSPETSIFEVQRLFVEEEIHGAPVVDDQGVVRGVVSSLDLLRAARNVHEERDSTSSYFGDELPALPDWDEIPAVARERLRDLTVSDVMTRELVVVAADAPIAEVARVMHDQHVHRVLVLDDSELVGLITSFDVLRVFVHEPPQTGEALHYDPSA